MILLMSLPQPLHPSQSSTLPSSPPTPLTAYSQPLSQRLLFLCPLNLGRMDHFSGDPHGEDYMVYTHIILGTLENDFEGYESTSVNRKAESLAPRKYWQALLIIGSWINAKDFLRQWFSYLKLWQKLICCTCWDFILSGFSQAQNFIYIHFLKEQEQHKHGKKASSGKHLLKMVQISQLSSLIFHFLLHSQFHVLYI